MSGMCLQTDQYDMCGVQHLQAHTVVLYLLVPEALYKINWLGGIQHHLRSIVYLMLKILTNTYHRSPLTWAVISKEYRGIACLGPHTHSILGLLHQEHR
jgi:hypothetical protein